MTAKLIKHSKSSVNGKEILTYELTYPRIVHAELMTHRLFSRNAASSRAIPIDKLIKLVEEDCAMPAEWGLNQAGMQAKGVHEYPIQCEAAWLKGATRAIETSKELQALGLHKQVCNRPLECYQYIKTIVTATEWDNWFWLRDHEDADPTIQKLAREMWEAKEASTAQVLEPGQYHLPYVDSLEGMTLDEAIKVSTSCCAQVSYRVLDDSLDKAIRIYDQLVTRSPVHASPFEHVATPMAYPCVANIQEGIQFDCMDVGEHVDSNGNFWSGNLKAWEQYRQTIPNNACWDYQKSTKE